MRWIARDIQKATNLPASYRKTWSTLSRKSPGNARSVSSRTVSAGNRDERGKKGEIPNLKSSPRWETKLKQISEHKRVKYLTLEN